MPLADNPWLPAIPPFLLASVVCSLAVPGTMWLARQVGAVAWPDGERHLHQRPTPRLGGLALFAGFGVAVAVFGGPLDVRWQVVSICALITVAMAVDDILNLPPWTKLTLEVGAGMLVAAMGITISFIALPGHRVDLIWLAAPVTVVWVAGMQISINLLDGSDGVAAGVVAIVAGILLLAAINKLGSSESVQNGVIILCGALMGCCFGFLFWNVAPARVFMGDSGSHFLGTALAMVTILGVAKEVAVLSIALPLPPPPPAAGPGAERARDGDGLLPGDGDPRLHRPGPVRPSPGAVRGGGPALPRPARPALAQPPPRAGRRAPRARIPAPARPGGGAHPGPARRRGRLTDSGPARRRGGEFGPFAILSRVLGQVVA
ncbi:MAG: undecaprenyl/decaprenyl-phosphate alpha-N-acetylglucosaminyl 1-phosphate transferase [Chloroflexi bacterium]|nr:MAG: undecaprenyl/decaprenyl-phosphate alpha-N-acetylglucosaminyl 1-phosphate transferase [Chloroflexota bacterium]